MNDAGRAPFFSEHRIVERLEASRDALAAIAPEPVPLPYKGNTVEIFNRYSDFAAACYSSKLEELCRGTLAEYKAERYASMAVICRAVVENAAVLHHLVREPVFKGLLETSRSESQFEDVLRKAMERLYRFTHGNNFQWDAMINKDREAFMSDARVSTGTLSQIRIGREAMRVLNRTYAGSKPLYNLLTDLAHPNLGSNLLVLTLKNGRLACGSRRRFEGAQDIALKALGGVEELLRKHTLEDVHSLRALKV